MKIVERNVKDLIPYVNNARTHSDEQVSQIAASIKEFGFTNPILIDSDSGIIAGHGRLAAARKLDMVVVPTIELSGLSDAQRKAYILADNKLALNAGWDIETLKIELQDLKELDFDLELTGFSTEEISDFLADPEVLPLEETDPIPEPEDNPITKKGDVWILGKHRLKCGDSTIMTDVDVLMDGGNADICFTSPPYNAGSINQKGNKGTHKKYNSFDDNQSSDQFFNFLMANMNCMMDVSNEVFYNMGLVEGNKRDIFKLINAFTESFKDIIYWKKSSVAPHIQSGVVNNLVEFILCFGDGRRMFSNAQFSQGSYWNVIEGPNASQNKYSEIHKATFPLYLPLNIINNFTKPNAIVIDCFGGTGTTLMACEQTNRRCFMMELDPKYCDVIVKRWQNYVGKDAILESNGKTFNELSKQVNVSV